MDSSNPSSNSAHALLRRDDGLRAVRRRNKALILIFFSLIIVLAIITGVTIVSVVRKINSPTPKTNPAIREFCSVSYSEFLCINSLSYRIKTESDSKPDRILYLSLQASLKQLSDTNATASNGTRPEPAFVSCLNSTRHAMGQLNNVLDLMRVQPELETRTYEQMRDMSEWINIAAEDLGRCVGDLGKVGSTALDGVIEVGALVGYCKEFLANSDVVNENFRFGLRNIVDRSYRNQIVEDLVAVSLFGSHYFVLLFLFCLLLRIY